MLCLTQGVRLAGCAERAPRMDEPCTLRSACEMHARILCMQIVCKRAPLRLTLTPHSDTQLLSPSIGAQSACAQEQSFIALLRDRAYVGVHMNSPKHVSTCPPLRLAHAEASPHQLLQALQSSEARVRELEKQQTNKCELLGAFAHTARTLTHAGNATARTHARSHTRSHAPSSTPTSSMRMHAHAAARTQLNARARTHAHSQA